MNLIETDIIIAIEELERLRSQIEGATMSKELEGLYHIEVESITHAIEFAHNRFGIYRNLFGG